MKTSDIKKNIHKAANKIDDESLLEAVYTILEKQIDNDPGFELTTAQKKELDRRLTNHKKGFVKSSHWVEVKKRLAKATK